MAEHRLKNIQMDQNILKIKQEVVEIEYTPIYNEDHDSKKESICRNISEVKQEIVEEGNSCNLQGKCEWSDTAVCSLGQKAIFLHQHNLNKVKQEPDEQENTGLLVADMEMQYKEEPFTGKICKREPSEILPSQELKTDLDPLARRDCLGINVYFGKEECTFDYAGRNGDQLSIDGENEVDETGSVSYQLELHPENIGTDLPSTSKMPKLREKWSYDDACKLKIYSLYICDHCNGKFTSKVKLRHHIAEHLNTKYRNPEDKPYQCPVCEKSFGQISKFKRHLRIHTGEKPYQCPVCEKSFKHNSHLKDHLLVHTGDKPYQCPVCEKSFSRNGDLKRHLRIHTGDKPYQCLACEKSFSENQSLKQHLRIHTGDKPYQCPVCKKSFSQNQHLKDHLRLHTGDKPYQCPVCEKSFSRNEHLKDHLRIHTGDKPYQCPVCEKSFSRNHHLKQHLRIHTGDKPYQCPACEKSFSESQSLKQHLRIHTGDKPYQCPVCEKAFSQNQQLKRPNGFILVTSLSSVRRVRKL